MLDITKLKTEFIPISEVPTGRSRNSPWDIIFDKVPKGQALVLKEPEVSAGTIRAALQRKHKAGKYKHLSIVTKGAHGTAAIYILNNDKSPLR